MALLPKEGAVVRPEEQAVVEQIVANPFEEELRLIYADWLEDQGDVRADYVRLQSDMDALPVYSDQYQQLKAKRNQIRKSLDQEWLEWLGYGRRHRPMFQTLPEKREHRWMLLEQFLENWGFQQGEDLSYSDEEVDEAERRLQVKLPLALREFYVSSAPRHQIWDDFNLRFCSPSRLHFHSAEGPLVIQEDHHPDYSVSIRQEHLDLDDPPVFHFRASPDNQEQIDASLTESVLVTALWSLSCLYGTRPYMIDFPEDVPLADFRDNLRCPLLPSFDEQFYEGPNVIACTSSRNELLALSLMDARSDELLLSEELRTTLCNS